MDSGGSGKIVCRPRQSRRDRPFFQTPPPTLNSESNGNNGNNNNNNNNHKNNNINTTTNNNNGLTQLINTTQTVHTSVLTYWQMYLNIIKLAVCVSILIGSCNC